MSAPLVLYPDPYAIMASIWCKVSVRCKDVKGFGAEVLGRVEDRNADRDERRAA